MEKVVIPCKRYPALEWTVCQSYIIRGDKIIYRCAGCPWVELDDNKESIKDLEELISKSGLKPFS